MVGVTYPPGTRGTAIPARTERGRLPRANTLRLDLSTARERERVAISGVSLWAIDGGDAEISLFLRYDQNDGIPFSSGMRLTGIPFDEIFVTNDAQSGKNITLLYTEALLEAESPARLFAEITSYVQPYDYIESAAGYAVYPVNAGIVWPANSKRRVCIISFLAAGTINYTFKRGSAPATIGDGFLVLESNSAGGQYEFYDDGLEDIYARHSPGAIQLNYSHGLIR